MPPSWPELQGHLYFKRLSYQSTLISSRVTAIWKVNISGTLCSLPTWHNTPLFQLNLNWSARVLNT